MHFKRLLKKGTACAVAAALALTGMAALTSCGSKDSGDSSTDISETGTDEAAANSSGTEKVNTSDSKSEGDTAMGRYLEEDVAIPDNYILGGMCFLDDGTLRISYQNEEYKAYYADSRDGGQTWEEPVSLPTLLGIDENKGYSVSSPWLASDGGMLLSVSTEEDSDSSVIFYYVDPQGNNQKLDLTDKLTSPYISEVQFYGNDTILIDDIGNGILEVNVSDGSIIKRFEEGGTVQYFAVVGKRLLVVTDMTLHYYDLETGAPLEDASALTEQFTSTESNLTLTSTSSTPAVFTEGNDADSLFYADEGGMYSYSFGGSVVEQLIDGKLNSLGSPDIQLVSLDVSSDGNIYAAVLDESQEQSQGKLLKYVYSADTPTVPDTELTVYSLTDNSYLRQVAALFQKKYPDIYLNVETGMSGDDAVTATDAIKNLNTEVMSGSGPDVLILDGLPADTYVEKGMLADISDILNSTDESDGILDNIRSPYVKEDGSQYMMPVKFSIPMIVGPEDLIGSVTDLSSLADMVENFQPENTDNTIPLSQMTWGAEGFLTALADVNAPAWIKDDGTLDEEAVTEYLKQAERIWKAASETTAQSEKDREESGMDFSAVMKSYPEYVVSLNSYCTTLPMGAYITAEGRLSSPDMLGDVYSTEKIMDGVTDKLWNGQAENCFISEQTIGISAKSAHMDAAKKLVEFLFSEEGQRIGREEGLPVNEKVYNDTEYWGEPEKNTSTLGSSNTETGEYFEMNIYNASAEKRDEIIALGKTLTTPSKSSTIIVDAVAQAGARCLNGEITLEEAAQEAIRQVNLYLSE